MKPLGKVKIKWSPEFAYAIGLLTTDGYVSKDGRHVVLVSKDQEQLTNFLNCLKINNKISRHISGGGRYALRTQFGDVLFYRFLVSTGVTSCKSKTLGKVDIPRRYFFDFLRGHFDGDGCFYSYFDPRWKSSYMFYTTFLSASKKHILWLRERIYSFLGIKGHITESVNSSVYQLKYAKADSLQLLPRLYYNRHVVCLSRKRKKIEKALKVVSKHL